MNIFLENEKTKKLSIKKKIKEKSVSSILFLKFFFNKPSVFLLRKINIFINEYISGTRYFLNFVYGILARYSKKVCQLRYKRSLNNGGGAKYKLKVIMRKYYNITRITIINSNRIIKSQILGLVIHYYLRHLICKCQQEIVYFR